MAYLDITKPVQNLHRLHLAAVEATIDDYKQFACEVANIESKNGLPSKEQWKAIQEVAKNLAVDSVIAAIENREMMNPLTRQKNYAILNKIRKPQR